MRLVSTNTPASTKSTVPKVTVTVLVKYKTANSAARLDFRFINIHAHSITHITDIHIIQTTIIFSHWGLFCIPFYAVPFRILFQYSHGNILVFKIHIVHLGFA